MAHPITLPSKTFKTKKDASSFFKEILNKYDDDEIITGNDDKLLFELIQRHPEATEKIGNGILKFYKAKSGSFNTSCFHIERIDGSKTDFSYASCISSKIPTAQSSFYKACHASVDEVLRKKKKEYFNSGDVVCFKTGAVIGM
jgi:hypothetical protein